LGIDAPSQFIAFLQSDQAMAMNATGGIGPTDITIDGRTSHALDFIAEGVSVPVSTLFATEGYFSSPTEDFWGTIWAGGAIASDPLIHNYQHSETPVKYIRLDDITLEYTGTQLTRVTKEQGDDKVLEYTGTQLTKITDNYHGITKDLAYAGTQLTGVVVSKII